MQFFHTKGRDENGHIFDNFGKKTFELIYHTKVSDKNKDIIEKSDHNHFDNAWSASLSMRSRLYKHLIRIYKCARISWLGCLLFCSWN